MTRLQKNPSYPAKQLLNIYKKRASLGGSKIGGVIFYRFKRFHPIPYSLFSILLFCTNLVVKFLSKY